MLEIAVSISYALLAGSLVLIFFRLTTGPTFPDRIMALDFISAIVMCFIGVYAISSGVSDFIDVAVVVALMGFLGSVGFARFVEQEGDEQ